MSGFKWHSWEKNSKPVGIQPRKVVYRRPPVSLKLFLWHSKRHVCGDCLSRVAAGMLYQLSVKGWLD